MRPTAIIAAVASLALLPACTDETEPSPMPTSEDALTTATEEPEDVAVTSEPEETTEEPTTEEPDEPTVDAGAMTEESATAVVEEFLTVLADVYRGDAPIERLDSLYTEACTVCEALAGREASPEDTLEYVSSEAELAGETATVEAVARQTIDDTEAVLAFYLVWGGESWLIEGIAIQDPAG